MTHFDKIKIILIVILLGLVMPDSAYSQSTDSDAKSSIKQLAFANYLFAQKEYALAVNAYHRFIFFSPDDTASVDAQYKLGLSYMGLSQWNRALAVFQNVVDESENNHYVEAALYNRGACFSHSGDILSARQQYERMIASYPQGSLIMQANMMRALTFIDETRWMQAAAVFKQLSNYNHQSSVGQIAGHLALESQKAEQIPRRSPMVAGFMSMLLPGAGQTWCGRMSDGLFSLVLTSTFTYLAFRTADENNTASAAVFGVIGCSFYLGNIYGAQNAARQSYEQKIQTAQKQMRAEIINAL